MAIKKFWNYQSAYPWTQSTNGMLTDQSRIWLQTLYRTVVNIDTGGIFSAGGDLSGTNTNQTVIGLQTRHVSTTAPTNGQVLTWSSTNNDWEPATPGGGTVNFVQEVPAGTMNGTNKIFTLTYTPSVPASLVVYLNGVEQVVATDITVSAATLTYAVPPKSNDLMIAEYVH